MSLFFAVLYYYGFGLINTILNVYISPTIKNLKRNLSATGITWFISILLVNILILIFIIAFYYHKKRNSSGPSGPRGLPGEEGEQGNNCNMCNK